MAKNTVKNKAFVEAATRKIMGGDIPVVTEGNYKGSLMAAFNYYNRNYENKFLAKVVYAYVKKNHNSYYDIITKAPDYELQSLGKLISVVNDNGFLSETDRTRIPSTIESIYNKYKDVKQEDDTTPKVPVVSVDQRVIELARKHSEDIDYAIDAWFGGKKSDFSTKVHLSINNLSGAVAKRIGEYYKPTLNEIEEAILGADEQLAEGYSFLSKAELKKFKDFIKSIVDDCAQHQVIAKKPRIQKTKPPGVIVKRLKYMFEFAELNLKSVNPINIINADEVWLYNTKTRKLINYVALDGDALSIKGTTIINYDVSKSDSVTLRKPEEFFKSLVGGKRAMSNAAKAIKTKPFKPNGRVNADMIIVGAFL